MDTKKKINNRINELDKNFEKLIKESKLNISSIENLTLESIDDLKDIINNHIENLIFKKIEEKELINKKNKNGKIKDIN